MAEARPDGWFAGPVGPSSTVDEATRIAGRLAAPAEHSTGAGLPLRTPRAHLVPGAFAGEPGPPERSADEVRDTLRGHQSGVRRARRPD